MMLDNHITQLKPLHLRDLMADPTRASLMNISAAGLTLDFSHQRLRTDSLPILDAFARSQGLPERMKALMRGDCVNASESRPALHTALRDFSGEPIIVDGKDVMQDVNASWAKMKALCQTLQASPVTDVVVLGIGGSYWGSAAVYQALHTLPRRVRVHFLGDMEEAAFNIIVAPLSPETTSFLIISKSFTTPETLFNGRLAQAWLGDCLHDKAFPHAIAVTANISAAQDFGISVDHIFDMWSWVGGRYSVWSAVGLPIAICYGFDAFEAMLQGAYAMDQHAHVALPIQNMPMVGALSTFINTRYFGAATEAILPYGCCFAQFIPYVQQLAMESLGKQRTLTGERIAEATGPIVWGQTGLHAQHTFNQILHQGNHALSVDFIISLENNILRRSCLAQSYALTYGDPDNPCLHARIEGNQPHQILQYQQMTPAIMGALMAYYEHKTYLLACLFGINAFDQFGVQLAKEIMIRDDSTHCSV
jgi:glucose-6-phosphate isomerase